MSQIQGSPHDAPPASREKGPASGTHDQQVPITGEIFDRTSRSARWLSLACLAAALGVAAFCSCAIWQAGTLFNSLMAAYPTTVTRSAFPAPTSPSAPAAVASSRMFDAKPVQPAIVAGASGEPTLAATAPPSATAFETSVEAPEKVKAAGREPLRKAAAEITFALGEPPPATAPRIPCDDIFVYIISVAEDAPTRSAASLGIGHEGPARFRRPGDTIGDYNVLAIADDWSGLEPGVWLEKDGSVCRAKLAGNSARVHSALKPAPPPPRAARKRPKARRPRR